jgi:hypothetical protein
LRAEIQKNHFTRSKVARAAQASCGCTGPSANSARLVDLVQKDRAHFLKARYHY